MRKVASLAAAGALGFFIASAWVFLAGDTEASVRNGSILAVICVCLGVTYVVARVRIRKTSRDTAE